MNWRSRLQWICFLSLSLWVLSACSEADRTSNPAPPASEPAPISIPMEEPGIRGIITDVDSSAVRVEAAPAEEAGSPKAQVRLTPGTTVLHRAGDRVQRSDLTVGHNVSVWFDGPVMESYPVQGTAAIIVIEPVGFS